MDKKYVARNLPLKRDTVTALEAVQQQTRLELGFEPSLQEVVLYLIAFYERARPAALET